MIMSHIFDILFNELRRIYLIPARHFLAIAVRATWEDPYLKRSPKTVWLARYCAVIFLQKVRHINGG